MKNYLEFLKRRQTASDYNERLAVFVKEYLEYKKERGNIKLKILDIGCGKNIVLYDYMDKRDIYYGCDYYKNPNRQIKNYVQIDFNQERLTDKFKNVKFDVIFCGEVIEHLFSPDELLDEIKNLMHKKSILILSTPNLSYFVNRIIFLFGISPLFLENSSEIKLGRKLKILGQGNITEGHIRVFTYGALLDLLKLKNSKLSVLFLCQYGINGLIESL